VLTEIRNGDDVAFTDTDDPKDGVPNAPLGSVVHDHATVSSDNPNFIPPEGTVDFKFYKGTAAAPCSGDPVGSDLLVPLTGGEADSKGFGPLAAGTYGFIVTYNSSNLDKWTNGIGSCEPLTVDKGTLTIRTDIHNAAHQIVTSVVPGSTVHDTATLGQANVNFNPDLTQVSFKFFTTKDCTGASTDPLNVGNEGTYVAKSGNEGPLASGWYSFQASFAGDGNYNPAGPATCEQLGVFNASLTIGYWKNHLGPNGSCPRGLPTGTGCSANGPWVTSFSWQTLGAYSVNSIAKAAGVFAANNCSNASTSDSNAIACLAAQLLGAKLNVANSGNSCINGTITDADAFLTAVGYNGPGTGTLNATHTRAQAIALKDKLDYYNNNSSCI
jgi:hypothetical protein